MKIFGVDLARPKLCMRLWRLAMVLMGECLVYSMQIIFIPTCSASIGINSVTGSQRPKKVYIHDFFPPTLVGIM